MICSIILNILYRKKEENDEKGHEKLNMGEQERKRLLQFMIIFSIFFMIIIGRIAQLQFVKGEELREDSLKKRLYTQELTPSRGSILDTNGNTIVGNRKSYNVYVVPVEYQESLEKNEANIEEDSKTLATFTGVEASKIRENLLKEGSYYRVIKKDLDKEVVDKLKEEKIPGVGIETTTVRHYPQKGLLSNVIGFVGTSGDGMEGLEATYNDKLTGESGLLIVERDRKGNKIPSKQHEYKEATEGNSLTLTIDSQIQYIVEDELKKLSESDINPKSAYTIVQDVNTGEILAMASYPTYNPEEGGNVDIESRRNGTVQFNFEPGSIFKLVTLSAALDSGAFNKNSTIVDSAGYIQVGNHKIKNWNKKAGGTLTLHKAASDSNNVAMVKIGQKIGKETFYDYVHKLGFGQKTNVGLYGEEKGLLRSVDSLSSLDFATNNIGQSLMVTPIQAVNAVSAIANGGNLMQPYIVKEVADSNGKIVEQNKPKVIRRAISEETSETMREIMRFAVTDNGVKAANIPGFDIGGKTGTAQKVGENGGGYAAGKYVTSFAGIAPTKNPKYAIVTVVNEPQGAPIYGSTTAAPTAANILKRILLLNQEVDTSSINESTEGNKNNER